MRRSAWILAAALSLGAELCAGHAAETNAGQAAAKPGPTAAGLEKTPAAQAPEEKKEPTGSERRRAVKLFLAAAKLFEKGQYEEALHDDEQAAELDATNRDYRLAAEVARGHAVTALIQTAAKARLLGNVDGARAALAHAYQLDPHNAEVDQHLRELGELTALDDVSAQNEQATSGLGQMDRLEPAAGVHSFHLRANQRQLIEQVFKAYGIQTAIDESIRSSSSRFDVDDASFADAMHALSLATRSFYEPIDAHRALVALDTRENRGKFTRTGVETVYLSGMTATEMTDVGNLARNVFEVPHSSVDAAAGTLTLRASQSQLDAFNDTFSSIMDGRSQVIVDVKLIEIAHTSTRNTGVTVPQQVTTFNVYAEEQSILNANQDLVQQIISSGLAAPGDTFTILGILLASGQVSSSIFQNGILLFGGGITQSGITPQPLTANFNLNSSDSRELDEYQLRLGDGEEGTLKSGTRYPIQTSSYSSLGASSVSIPGLSTAGTSSSLTSILSSLEGASTTIPMVQYEDLGLVLKATPSVMRSGDVALNVDMKVTSLAGSSINGVPVLANRAWGGVVTVPQDQAVVVAAEMDSNEVRAVSGMPGLTEIPGLADVTNNDVQKNTSTLLIVMTPHVVRSPRVADHTRMVRIEKDAQTR